MFGWFTRKKQLLKILTELAADYLKTTEEKGARIEELEGQLKKAKDMNSGLIEELRRELRKARDETNFVIAAFSSQIQKIKTDLQRLRLEEETLYIESQVVKSQARAMYLLGQSESIPWEELEKQASLITRLMAARQEYQQT